MTRLNFLVTAIAIIIALLSCSKNDSEVKLEYSLELRSLGMDSFEYHLGNIWELVLNHMTLEEICGCNCDDFAKKATLIDQNENLLPIFIRDLYFDTSCDTLKYLYGKHCNHDDLKEFLDENIALLYSLDSKKYPVTMEEKQLLERMYLQLYQNPFSDLSQFERDWNDLESISEINNRFSLVLIKISNSIQFWMKNTDVFDINEEPQAIVWKATNVAAGFLGTIIVTATWDIIKTKGDGRKSTYTGKQMLEDATKGAIVGLMT